MLTVTHNFLTQWYPKPSKSSPTRPNEQHTIDTAMIPTLGLAACRHLPHLALAGTQAVGWLLKVKSAPRICSTCSLEVVAWEVAHLAAAALAADPVGGSSCCVTPVPHALLSGVFTASFGPGGFRTARMGGQGGARREGAQETQSSMLVQLLPLIILIGFSLLNALPTLLSGPSYPDPIYTFAPTSSYGAERSTPKLGVKYYVNEAQLNSHPIIGVELSQAASRQGTKSGKAMRQFEEAVEQKYTSQVRSRSSSRSHEG
jgi:hypothetical protein